MSKNTAKLRQRLKRAVYFAGYYGQCNTGDDSFCEVSAWGARTYWKTEEIGFISAKMPTLREPVKKVLTDNPRFRGQNILHLTKKLLQKPVVVFSGGSIFHQQPRFMSDKNVLFQIKKVWPYYLGAIGVSIGPFKSKDDKDYVRSQLTRLDFLSLRDKISYELACEMDLPYRPIESFDLAALLVDIYGNIEAKPENIPLLGVSVCRYETFTGADPQLEIRRIENTVRTLSYVSKKCKLKIRFLVFNGDSKVGDTKISEQIAEKVSEDATTEIVYYSETPEKMWNAVGQCNAVLATRLHAGIFSYFTKTPFVLVEYHRKCTDFLNAVNYPENLKIGDYKKNPEHVAECLLSLLRNDYKVNFDVEYFRAKAERNFTEIFK